MQLIKVWTLTDQLFTEADRLWIKNLKCNLIINNDGIIERYKGFNTNNYHYLTLHVNNEIETFNQYQESMLKLKYSDTLILIMQYFAVVDKKTKYDYI